MELAPCLTGFYPGAVLRPVSQRYYDRLLGVIGPISLCLLLIRVIYEFVIVAKKNPSI